MLNKRITISLLLILFISFGVVYALSLDDVSSSIFDSFRSFFGNIARSFEDQITGSCGECQFSEHCDCDCDGDGYPDKSSIHVCDGVCNGVPCGFNENCVWQSGCQCEPCDCSVCLCGNGIIDDGEACDRGSPKRGVGYICGSTPDAIRICNEECSGFDEEMYYVCNEECGSSPECSGCYAWEQCGCLQDQVCKNRCQCTYCGNGILEDHEVCDRGIIGPCDPSEGCNYICGSKPYKLRVCNEECSDYAGEETDAICFPLCGASEQCYFLKPGDECDEDRNGNNDGVCDGQCRCNACIGKEDHWQGEGCKGGSLEYKCCNEVCTGPEDLDKDGCCPGYEKNHGRCEPEGHCGNGVVEPDLREDCDPEKRGCYDYGCRIFCIPDAGGMYALCDDELCLYGLVDGIGACHIGCGSSSECHLLTIGHSCDFNGDGVYDDGVCNDQCQCVYECSETDNGDSPLEYGECTDTQGILHQDRCCEEDSYGPNCAATASSDNLLEWRCSLSGDCRWNNYICPENFPGTICMNGECVDEEDVCPTDHCGNGILEDELCGEICDPRYDMGAAENSREKGTGYYCEEYSNNLTLDNNLRSYRCEDDCSGYETTAFCYGACEDWGHGFDIQKILDQMGICYVHYVGNRCSAGEACCPEGQVCGDQCKCAEEGVTTTSISTTTTQGAAREATKEKTATQPVAPNKFTSCWQECWNRYGVEDVKQVYCRGCDFSGGNLDSYCCLGDEIDIGPGESWPNDARFCGGTWYDSNGPDHCCCLLSDGSSGIIVTTTTIQSLQTTTTVKTTTCPSTCNTNKDAMIQWCANKDGFCHDVYSSRIQGCDCYYCQRCGVASCSSGCESTSGRGFSIFNSIGETLGSFLRVLGKE